MHCLKIDFYPASYEHRRKCKLLCAYTLRSCLSCKKNGAGDPWCTRLSYRLQIIMALIEFSKKKVHVGPCFFSVWMYNYTGRDLWFTQLHSQPSHIGLECHWPIKWNTQMWGPPFFPPGCRIWIMIGQGGALRKGISLALWHFFARCNASLSWLQHCVCSRERGKSKECQ